MAIGIDFRPTVLSLTLVGAILLLSSCGGSKSTDEKDIRTPLVPVFNADSAYAFVEKQVSFGPRVPNTPAHVAAGDYLIEKLKSYGATITVQRFEATSFDGQRLALRNIIASFQPAIQKRILLAAHWDTRPFADKDPVSPDGRMDGANDGASGVAVLLESARVIASGPLPAAGVDFIFFDGEDWGEKQNTPKPKATANGQDSWWCLGSQYWSSNKHKPSYQAYYGILLDMVGGKSAKFFKEGTSLEYAPQIVSKVWKIASNKGYSSYFINQDQPAILDDHQFLNERAQIPTIDIIAFDPATESFGAFHHTKSDNLSVISKETLHVVGTVLLTVIYTEE